jgi:hypothetical protein
MVSAIKLSGHRTDVSVLLLLVIPGQKARFSKKQVSVGMLHESYGGAMPSFKTMQPDDPNTDI